MKKVISLLLILSILLMPIGAFAEKFDVIESWVSSFYYETGDYTHDTLVALFKQCISEGLITLDEVYELADPDAEPYKVITDDGRPKNVTPWWIKDVMPHFRAQDMWFGVRFDKELLKKFIQKSLSRGIIHIEEIAAENTMASSDYAKLEIITKDKAKVLGKKLLYTTFVDNHFYSISMEYDPMEEVYSCVLLKDGNNIYTFGGDYFPRGIRHIGSAVYIAQWDGIYRLDNDKALTKIASFDDKTGYPYALISNNKSLYTVTSPSVLADRNVGNFDASFYKVTPKGEVIRLKGYIPVFDNNFISLSVNADEDRYAYGVPLKYNATLVTKMSTGELYAQRNTDNEGMSDGFVVDNVIYYNNCLIANVNGGLVYYNEKNERKILLGDLGGWRTDHYRKMPCRGDLPIQSGTGDKVNIGTVVNWEIGSDGNIYGYTWTGRDKKDNYIYEYFKLTLPDKVKTVNTYKKLEK